MSTTALGEHMQGSDLLDVVALAQRIVRDGEVDLLVAVVEFCACHPPVDGADRCRVAVPAGTADGRESLEPLTGEGVPEVSALAVSQLGATLGLSPGSVQRLVAEALELGYRLPDLYAQVQAGRVPVWQARRVAKATGGLSRGAARFVDRHLHGLTGSISIGSLDRLIAEAIARHDHARQVQVDRARAVGDLSREHLAAAGQGVPTAAVWDDQARTLTPVPAAATATPDSADRAPVPSSTTGCSVRKGARREVMLHLHITDQELAAALRGTEPDAGGRGRPLLGRAEHARTGDLPVTAETIRSWCDGANTSIRVLPVLDQQQRIHHDAYEIPDRLRE